MITKFKEQIKKQQFFKADDKLLLACSGGRDSMVLASLLMEAGYTFALAHYNFSLRGSESDEDEAFVKRFAEQHTLVFHREKQDTEKYVKQNGMSVEMAAREIRYIWFEELIKQYGYTKVLTAHHADDSIETFFINLLRGTGIDGLKGISTVNNRIVRPLLFFYRSEIDEYVNEKNIAYREDSSNLTDVYLRNKIRHNLVPLLEELEPQFKQIMQGNMIRLAETSLFVNDTLDKIQKDIVIKEGKYIKIFIEKLLQYPLLLTVRILKKYDFTPQVIIQIYQSLNSEPGKLFYSETHRLVKDREYLIIEKSEGENINFSSQEFEVKIFDDTTEITKPIDMKFQRLHPSGQGQAIEISREKNVATLDFDLLTFPLTLRKWKEGDNFQPFGMKGKKLLSDFFIDEKFSIPEKESTWLLCSGNDIVWVVGYRIDDRFRISQQTQTIYTIEALM